MDIPILFENHGLHYRAWCRWPVFAEATGPSRYEARLALEEKLRAALGHEVETLQLEADTQHPWLGSVGWVPDDDVTELWLAGIEAYRRERNGEPNTATPSVTPGATPLPDEARV